MSGFGVFLAIATAFSWALGCVVHTTASRVVGIPAVMLIRQPLASVVLGIFCLVMGDLWLPSLHLFAGYGRVMGVPLFGEDHEDHPARRYEHPEPALQPYIFVQIDGAEQGGEA